MPMWVFLSLTLIAAILLAPVGMRGCAGWDAPGRTKAASAKNPCTRPRPPLMLM